jgi:hypothetical protein
MRRNLWWSVCAVAGALALAASMAVAGDEHDHGSADKDAMMEAWMAAAAPGEPHAFLAKMTGDWKTRTTHYEMGEAGEPTDGTASFKSILGGRVVKGQYTGVMWGQPFEGMSMDGYDNITGKYWSTWIDNTGTSLYVTEGKMLEDGKSLEHTGMMTMPDGSQCAMRFVTTRESGEKATMNGYMTMPGAEEMITMKIEFTRASS